MNLEIKLFTWADTGNHLIIIARGVLNRAALAKLFAEIAAATRPLSECKVLVDLTDVTCALELSEIDALVNELPYDSWPEGNKLALMAGAERDDHYQIYLVRAGLTSHGLAVGAFRDSKMAIDWLAGGFR